MSLLNVTSMLAKLLALAIIALFAVCADAGTTIPLALSLENDTIIPFTAAFNKASFDSNVTVDAGYQSAAMQQIATLNSAFPFDTTTCVGFAIDNLELDFDIEFGLLSSGAGMNHFSYQIASEPVGHIQLPPEAALILQVSTLDFTLNADLFAQIQSQAPTRFSTGFKVQMLNPAGMIMQFNASDFIHPSKRSHPQFFPTGLSAANFNVTPLFNTSDPTPEYQFELAFRTQLVLSTIDFTLVKLNLDLPAYTINASQITGNVDYTCNNAQSHPPDESYANLTSITQAITTDASWQLSNHLGNFSGAHPIFPPQILHNLTSQCFAFSPFLNVQVPAPKFPSELGSSAVLSPVQSPSPSKHISNGGAIGIFLATEILLAAMVVAVLCCFKSRHAKRDRGEGQHHSFKKGEVFGFLAGVGLATMSVFKRKRRDETNRDEYALRAGQHAEHNWVQKEPLVTTPPAQPADSLGGVLPHMSPAPYSRTSPTGNDFGQAQQQYQQAPVSIPAYYPAKNQSGYPQQQDEYSPAPTTYNSAGSDIPWEEARSSQVLSVTRKAVPGRT